MISTVGMPERLQDRIWPREPCETPSTGFSRLMKGMSCMARVARPATFMKLFCP
jgi:hypothetical protein